MNRDQALAIVKKYVTNPNLIRHMLAVEVAMAAYAQRFAPQQEEKWRITGLLHDFDWEIHPNPQEHPLKGADILRNLGVDEEIVRAILSHADYTGVPRRTLLEKTLYACDELTGLITAITLVRPSKKIADVTVKSIKKKWKDKAFARGVNRQDIERGVQDLGVDLWQEHVPTVLKAMQSIAQDLDL